MGALLRLRVGTASEEGTLW
jgi:hypothetical protein